MRRQTLVLAPFVLKNRCGWSTPAGAERGLGAHQRRQWTYVRRNGPHLDREPVPPGRRGGDLLPATNAQLPDDFPERVDRRGRRHAPVVLVNVINLLSTAAMNYLASAPAAPMPLPLLYVARRTDGWDTNVLVYNLNAAPTT